MLPRLPQRGARRCRNAAPFSPGVPPSGSLITGIIGGVVVDALSGAPLQVSGPAAGLTVIVWDLVQTHGIAALRAGSTCRGFAPGDRGRSACWAVVPRHIAGGCLCNARRHRSTHTRGSVSLDENLLSIPESFMKALTPDRGLAHNQAALLSLLTITVLML